MFGLSLSTGSAYQGVEDTYPTTKMNFVKNLDGNCNLKEINYLSLKLILILWFTDFKFKIQILLFKVYTK